MVDTVGTIEMIKSIGHRPVERSDEAHRFCSFKGRSICLLRLLTLPFVALGQLVLTVLAVALKILQTLCLLCSAIFCPKQWKTFAFHVKESCCWIGILLCIFPKTVERAGRYLMGATIHPGVVIRKKKELALNVS